MSSVRRIQIMSGRAPSPSRLSVATRRDAAPELIAAKLLKPGQWFVCGLPHRTVHNRLAGWHSHGLSKKVVLYQDVRGRSILIHGESFRTDVFSPSDYGLVIRNDTPPDAPKRLPSNGFSKSKSHKYMMTASLLKPGEWFLVPKKDAARVQTNSSKWRHRYGFNLTTRRTVDGGLVVLRVPSTADAANTKPVWSKAQAGRTS